MKFRKESDSLGTVLVPADKYWGASTQRSNKYFNIGDFLVRPVVIQSIARKPRQLSIQKIEIWIKKSVEQSLKQQTK